MAIQSPGESKVGRTRVRRLGRLPEALPSLAPDSLALSRHPGESGNLAGLPHDPALRRVGESSPLPPGADPKLQDKVLTSAAAAATAADKAVTGQAATPAAKAQGVAQAVIPVATAVAEASGNEQAKAVVKNTADASTAAIQLKAAGDSFARAAETVRDGAAPVASTAGSAPAISSFGRLAAGLDITRGVLAAPQLVKQVETVAANPQVLKNPQFSQSLAGNAIAAGNGFIGAARLVNRTGLAARLSPWAAMAADAALMGASASDLAKKGFSAPTALELAAYGVDAVGNAVLIAGGNPTGLVLKGASLGMQAAAIGLRHRADITRFASDFKDGLLRVVS